MFFSFHRLAELNQELSIEQCLNYKRKDYFLLVFLFKQAVWDKIEEWDEKNGMLSFLLKKSNLFNFC